MNVFVTADTHFGHQNIQAYCSRPEGWEVLLQERWRKVVSPNDLVLHLGDVCFPKYFNWEEAMKQNEDACGCLLPGRKVLVVGNHDKAKSLNWWMTKGGFHFACHRFEWELYGYRIIFTHEPIPSFLGPKTINIHGHLHNTGHRPGCVGPNHILFAPELQDYQPRLLVNLIQEWERQQREVTSGEDSAGDQT